MAISKMHRRQPQLMKQQEVGEEPRTKSCLETRGGVCGRGWWCLTQPKAQEPFMCALTTFLISGPNTRQKSNF